MNAVYKIGVMGGTVYFQPFKPLNPREKTLTAQSGSVIRFTDCPDVPFTTAIPASATDNNLDMELDEVRRAGL